MKIQGKAKKFKNWVFKYISSKIDIYEILYGHYETLKSYKNNKRRKDLSTFFLIPLIFAIIIILLFGGKLDSEASNSILNALSIFTPIMFTLLVSIYNINRKRLVKMKVYMIIKEFKNNVSFIIVLSLICIFIIIVSSLKLSIPFVNGFGWLYNLIYSLIIIYLLGIIGLTLLQVLKRWNSLLDAMLKEIKPHEEKIF